jgi:hypothetical protein
MRSKKFIVNTLSKTLRIRVSALLGVLPPFAVLDVSAIINKIESRCLTLHEFANRFSNSAGNKNENTEISVGQRKSSFSHFSAL